MFSQSLKINYCAFLKVLLVFELAEMPAPLPGLVSLETWRMEVFGVDITRPPAMGPDIFFFLCRRKPIYTTKSTDPESESRHILIRGRSCFRKKKSST